MENHRALPLLRAWPLANREPQCRATEKELAAIQGRSCGVVKGSHGPGAREHASLARLTEPLSTALCASYNVCKPVSSRAQINLGA